MNPSGRCRTCDAPLYADEAACRYCGSASTDLHDHNDMRAVAALVVAALLVAGFVGLLAFA